MVLTVSVTNPDTLESETLATLVTGSHFYSMVTMDKTLLGRIRTQTWDKFVTNAEHQDTEIFLHRIAFWIVQNHAEIFCTEEEIDEDLCVNKILSCFGISQVLCLIWMCICPEFFDKGKAVHSESFLSQRHNTQVVCQNLLHKMLATEGKLGECIQACWSQLADEMDNHVIHKDDVISPARCLIMTVRNSTPSYDSSSKEKNLPTL